jgi:uroporphyrinogen III methyltransferase/synthase
MSSTRPPATLPLRSKRIVVTRARDQAGDLVAQLRALGAEPLECPAIAIVPPLRYAPLDAAIQEVTEYDWVIFTSSNGVAFFLERLAATGQAFGRQQIGAIGPATAAALAAAGHPPDFVPGTYVAEAIVAEIGDVAGQHILLPRAVPGSARCHQRRRHVPSRHP